MAELVAGGVRPNPLLPLRKKKEEDAWEEPVDALGQIGSSLRPHTLVV